MEGFLNIRMRPWLRRLITRALAIIPAALTIYIVGRPGHATGCSPEPGDPQHATALRHHSADAFHQRLAAHGAFANRLGESALLDYCGGDSPRISILRGNLQFFAIFFRFFLNSSLLM